MTRREAETCRVLWTFFLPYRPNGCAYSMANPNYLALPSRRFGGHGALSRENGKRRGKTVQALNRLFVFPRRSIDGHSIFALTQRKNRISWGYQNSKSVRGGQKGILCPWPLLLPKMLLPKMLRPNTRPLYVSPSLL